MGRPLGLASQDSQGNGTPPSPEHVLGGSPADCGERPRPSDADLLPAPLPGRRTVRVLEEDPDLARQLDPARADAASRLSVAGVVSLPKGVFCPQEWFPNYGGTFGALLLDGLLLRGVHLARRSSVEVLGVGDLVRPLEPELDSYAAIAPDAMQWWALRPARLAVLDASFIRRLSDYPEVIGELAGRLWRGSAAGCLRLSIVQQPRLSTRVEFILWHLADRFVRFQREGVLLAVPLCQALVSWLVGASRPAVCRALKELEQAGRVEHRPDGTWWLYRRPDDLAQPTLAVHDALA